MRILITGAKGLLGRELVQVLSSAHEVAALGREELDIADPAQVEAALARYRPQWLVNAAAFTRVDACESEPELAFRVNATGPEVLARAAARHGVRLLHISTDYVFPGDRPVPLPYRETDPVGPLSVYGRSKLLGEEAVRGVLRGEAVIVRTAWLYGLGGPNFLKTMLRLALADPGRTLRVVDDQHGSPTWARTLAEQLKALVEADARGLFHASAEGHCTWYELAKTFFELLDLPVRLVPIPTGEYPTPAKRPSNSILDNRRLRELGLNLMRPWREDLEEFVRLSGAELMKECGGGG
ncbi:MAG: dTDP-4-dehydrorhamnose reductase [Desulfobaccales bacterium]